MVQFVVGDGEELKFYRVFERILKQTFLDIEAYYQNAYSSKELGTILYEQQLLPIYKVLEKSLFVKAYSEIVEGEKNLGTIPAYLRILYAIFGGEADIRITQQPLNLQIDVIAPIQSFKIWVTKQGDTVQDHDGNNIVFKEILAEVTNRDLLNILKSVTNAGTYVDFTLNKEEELR